MSGGDRVAAEASLRLRSLAFNAAFYVHMIVWMIAGVPLFALPRPWLMRAMGAWARSSLWLLRVLAGTRLELRGRDRVPAGGILIASKHQSAWDTFVYCAVFPDPAYVLKRELMWIPLFGWYAWKAGMIPVSRAGSAAALAAMKARARHEARRGRQLIIFPEGTRRPVGAPPAYKYGVIHLYKALDVPCVPAALNSGLYWPRRRSLRRPGTIVIEFLPPLPANLPRARVLSVLQERIEPASERLAAEGRAALTGAAAAPPGRDLT